MCSAFHCFKQLFLTFPILSTAKKGWVTERVCAATKPSGIPFRWCRQHTASHAHFSQHSAPFVTLHNASCEQLCTCLRASKRLFIIVPHVFSRFSHPASFFLLYTTSTVFDCTSLAAQVWNQFFPLVTPLCENADRLSEWPTTRSSQVTSRTRLIPCSASTTAVSTRRSTLLHDGNVSINIEKDFKNPQYPKDSDHFFQDAVGSQRAFASTVPALMNLESMSCIRKPVRGYESIIESSSSTGKPMQFDESVASVERNWWKQNGNRH